MDGEQLGLVILLCISAVSGEYLFILPQFMVAGTTNSFCLLLNDIQLEGFMPEQGYTVDVRLKYMNRDSIGTETSEMQEATFEIVDQDGDFQKCQKVAAPMKDGRYSAVVNVSMTYSPYGLDSEATVDVFGAVKNIEARLPDLMALVQTDKPIYKPGQTVKFRVMIMDYMLMSKTDGYQQITIESPNGMRVMQWDDVPSPNGLVSLQMKLSSDPILGSWKIRVLYGTTEIVKAFKVDEYVLPKFEVTVTPPSYLLPTTQKISGTVCAIYTYGMSVKGTLKMSVCYSVDDDYIWFRRPCAYITTKINGCYEFFIDAEKIRLGSRSYSNWGLLKIDANVTEDQTGLELSGHSSGPSLTFEPLYLKIEDDSDNYFKPGFPYKGRVVATNPDGSPAPGEIIRVGLSYSLNSDLLWVNNFTSNMNGIVHFVITEFDSDMWIMYIHASATEREYDAWFGGDMFYRIHIRTDIPDTYLRLTKWYSPSDSYIYMPDVDEVAECDTELKFDVLYTAEAGRDYTFMTIVKAGDAVVYTEKKRITADDDIWNLDIIRFDDNQLLKRVEKPTPSPRPTSPPVPTIQYDDIPEVPPEPVPMEEIVEELTVPEVAQTFEEGEKSRKKRDDTEEEKSQLKITGETYVSWFSDIHLECNATGVDRAPEDVDWFYNSDLIRTSDPRWYDRIEIVKHRPLLGRSFISELIIHLSRVEDSGSYVCRSSDFTIDFMEVHILIDCSSFGCAKTIQTDQEFTNCMVGYSMHMSSLNQSDPNALTSAMCSEEGTTAVQCILDYLKSCPELLTDESTYRLFTAFKTIEDLGGYDVICNRSQGPDGKSNLVGHFQLKIPVSKEMSPSAKVLVFYIRKDKEVVATSLRFKIKNCFKNKVMMSFDDTTVRPGTNVSLNLGASPRSTCFVGMVDNSVNLLGGNDQLTPNQVFGHVKQAARPERYISDSEEERNYCEDKMKPLAPDEVFSYCSYSPERVDATKAFRDVELWVETDAKLQTMPCVGKGRVNHMSRDVSADISDLLVRKESQRIVMLDNVPMEDLINREPDQKAIRTFFPETWLWDVVTIGDDGTLSFETNIPDTITEWIGNTVCTHESDGVGVTELTSVTSFKPFFVSLTLPYSAIRGEILPVRATVFNYLLDCITLKVHFKEMEGFVFSDRSGNSREFCLCGGESESTKFHIIPMVIGEIDLEVTAVSTDNIQLCQNLVLGQLDVGVEDGVQRQLLIEAEGIPQDQTKSSYTCITAGEKKKETVDMNLPSDLVQDSERATVSVVGDIMGPTLSNLKNLLRMPYGCGEQNMASWSPNIYVLQYLENTDQLIEELEKEAEGYMAVGYQRQMKYRHSDNSYSAWGDNQYVNATGSSWLTAFVVKSMAQSSAYIVIDNDDIVRSARWLVNTQQDNGCFPQVGRVFSSYLKGGLEGDNPAGLTAFILFALLEADLGEEFMQNISYGFSSCLDGFDLATTDTYTLTVMLYAYTIYDIDGDRRVDVMVELNRRRVDKDGLVFWQRGEDETEKEPEIWWYRAPSAEVEMTAYVLLSMLAQGPDVIVEVQPIVQWLTKQRNPYGGFSSTQDTVVALQALAEFGKLTYSGSKSVTIEIKNTAMDHVFSVSPSNSLVFQSVEVNPSQGAVEITTSGTGCALVQVNMKYNIYTEEDDGPAFNVKVRVFRSETNSNNCAMRTLDVCTSYLKGGVSNMAIAEVKMPTGWKPIPSTLNALVQSNRIQKCEVDNNYVQLYFDEFSSERLCVNFEVEQELEMNPKASLVRVYDYYETGYSVTVNYTIKTSCGTKEEIPLDNEGLDCSIMQCRVDTSKSLEMARSRLEKTCPTCLDTVDNTKLETMVCEADAVYRAVVRRLGKYTVKLIANLRPKTKVGLDKFVNETIYQDCSCPILESGRDKKTLIFSTGKEEDFFIDEDNIRFGEGQTLIPYTSTYKNTVRRISSRRKLCDKLSRLRRSRTEKSASRLQSLRRKLGVL